MSGISKINLVGSTYQGCVTQPSRLPRHEKPKLYLIDMIIFLDPPYVITETTSLINLEEEKDSVTMKCMSESNPPSKVWWEKEGVNGVFSPDREITISPVTRSTAGTYKCVAQNALGLSEPGFVEVDVKCKLFLNVIRLG